MKTIHALASAALIAALGAPAMAGVVITLEAPGVSNTSQSFAESGVETFDNRAAGANQSFTSDFGGTSGYTGDYSNVQIMNHDSWGGVDNSRYAVSLGQGSSYTLQLNKSADYFGFYLLALSSGNKMEFFNGNTSVLTLGYNDLLSHLTPDYNGSPYPGQTGSEYFAFLNFNFTDGDSYNKIVFSNSGTDGFESDNHTIGINAVPEPATWAMLILGFGLVGVAARRRRITSAIA